MSTNEHLAGIVQTLRRIRHIIGDSVRCVQAGQTVDRQLLISAENNLNRISSLISLETFNKLHDSINDVLNYIQSTRDDGRYASHRSSSGGNSLCM